MSKKQLLLYGALGVAGYAAWEAYKYFRNDGKGDEAILPDCVANLPDIEMVAGKGGVVVGKLPDGIDEKSNGHGGLYFWPNKRVTTVDTQVKGTYSCVGSTPAVVSEQENPYAGIKIVWDDEIAAAAGGGTTFNPCTSFPFQYKCKNEKIKQMQVCLKFEPKYQTGNYGSITDKALDIKCKSLEIPYSKETGITEKIYNAVVADCKREPVEPIAKLEPKPAGLIPTGTDGGLKLQQLAPRTATSASPDAGTPYDFYKSLYQAGNFNVPDNGDGRIRYKGPELDAAQLAKLDEYFTGQGYYRRRTVPKPGDEIKYVWAPTKE